MDTTSSTSTLTGNVLTAISIRRCTSNLQCTMISLSLAGEYHFPNALEISPPSSPSLQSSQELEICIGFKLLYRLLTNFFSTGDSVTWSLFPQGAQGRYRCAG